MFYYFSITVVLILFCFPTEGCKPPGKVGYAYTIPAKSADGYKVGYVMPYKCQIGNNACSL